MLTASPDEDQLMAWAIDVGDALVAYPSDFAKLDLAVPEKPNIARGLPLALMEAGAYRAAKRAAGLAGSMILKKYIFESCTIAGEKDGALLLEAVNRRMEHASELVEAYLKVLGART